ncbi:MAG: glycosyltransferase family 4 protein [Candidatus Sericytochromatia bacterium]|nr:glycosyltransferase family 4 protein [Candidatus Sericytochromatia bacterium]
MAPEEPLHSRALNICLVSREHPSLPETGGIGTYTDNLAKGLAARGHCVTVLADGEPPSSPPRPQAGTVRLLGVGRTEAFRLPFGRRWLGTSSRSLAFALAAGKRYQALDRQDPFDVVEVPEYQAWGLGVSLVRRCPLIARLHSHTRLVRALNAVPLTLDDRLCTRLEAQVLRRAERVLANSQALAREASRDFPGLEASRRLEVLPLGIDTQRFKPSEGGPYRRAHGLDEQAILLLYVGRLERRKGVLTLWEAFARLAPQLPQLHLHLAGYSTDLSRQGDSVLGHLQRLSRESGLADRIRFLGHRPYQELPALYGACDVFVAPSPFEPFGMVYLEAMACGKPVVACRAGGALEIIEHGRSGLLVPASHPEALANALRTTVENEAWRRRLGEAAHQEVQQRFTLAQLAARTESHYRTAVAAHQASDAGCHRGA